MLREIEERKDYLMNEVIDTIYFGGGTPSVLEVKEIANILDCIYRFYPISSGVELSLEANPEDLKPEYLYELAKTGVNRLSIGIQSFQDSDLELMHRIHSGEQAGEAVKNAQNAGFDNISIDLIYGLPRQEKNVWQKNLDKALSLGIQHFSAYHLTYESGTVFDHWRKKGRIGLIPEEDSLNQFKILINTAKQQGFEHYEISNFALPGFQSKHNSSYWQQKKYLGIGPSAHSYNELSRRWNLSNHKRYIDAMSSAEDYFETETLSPENIYNEHVMTSLRTSKGVSYLYLKSRFGDQEAEHFRTAIEKFVKSGHVNVNQEIYSLTQEGIFIADHIIEVVFK